MRPIDADKLLQYWGPPGAGGPDFPQGDICDSINAQPTLDVVLANWISVKDRLPDAPGQYLVAYHPCYFDVVFSDVRVGTDSFRGKAAWAKNKLQRVTHWMPLPGAPADTERS